MFQVLHALRADNQRLRARVETLEEEAAFWRTKYLKAVGVDEVLASQEDPWEEGQGTWVAWKGGREVARSRDAVGLFRQLRERGISGAVTKVIRDEG